RRRTDTFGRWDPRPRVRRSGSTRSPVNAVKPLALSLLPALLAAHLALALAAAPAIAEPSATASATQAAATPSTADQRFEAIHEREWAWRKVQTGGGSDEDGDSAHAPACLTSVDAASQAARLAYWDEVLAELDAIDPAALSAENRINLAIYRPQVDNLAAEVR